MQEKKHLTWTQTTQFQHLEKLRLDRMSILLYTESTKYAFFQINPGD